MGTGNRTENESLTLTLSQFLNNPAEVRNPTLLISDQRSGLGELGVAHRLLLVSRQLLDESNGKDPVTLEILQCLLSVHNTLLDGPFSDVVTGESLLEEEISRFERYALEPEKAISNLREYVQSVLQINTRPSPEMLKNLETGFLLSIEMSEQFSISKDNLDSRSLKILNELLRLNLVFSRSLFMFNSPEGEAEMHIAGFGSASSSLVLGKTAEMAELVGNNLVLGMCLTNQVPVSSQEAYELVADGKYSEASALLEGVFVEYSDLVQKRITLALSDKSKGTPNEVSTHNLNLANNYAQALALSLLFGSIGDEENQKLNWELSKSSLRLIDDALKADYVSMGAIVDDSISLVERHANITSSRLTVSTIGLAVCLVLEDKVVRDVFGEVTKSIELIRDTIADMDFDDLAFSSAEMIRNLGLLGHLFDKLGHVSSKEKCMGLYNLIASKAKDKGVDFPAMEDFDNLTNLFDFSRRLPGQDAEDMAVSDAYEKLINRLS